VARRVAGRGKLLGGMDATTPRAGTSRAKLCIVMVGLPARG
jgi:hypothetical protein